MPAATWNRILVELNNLQLQDMQRPVPPGAPNSGDRYRRAKIAAVEKVTGRPLVVYATACTSPGKNVAAQMMMLDFSDKVGFKAVTENIPGPNLDILIHSPGGFAPAAESIVQQLRGKYSHIRFIVPSFAKSAATMLVMAGDEILMDADAELGPIDPQMLTPNGGASPAVAILEQFQKAQVELQGDATKLPSWMPILAQYGPSLLVDCLHAIDLAKDLVKFWTRTFMLRNDPEADAKSSKISEYLSDHKQFKSHARPIKIPDLVPLGVKVTNLKEDANLSLGIDELYACLDILLGNSLVCKIFDTSSGDALIRQSGMIQAQMIPAAPVPAAPARPGR